MAIDRWRVSRPAAAFAVAATLLLSACSLGQSDGHAQDADRSGPPRDGGVLHLVAPAGVELDPARAADPADRQLVRALTRQLMGYAAGAGPAARPVPDLADAPPRAERNATAYTVTLRSGAAWSTSPPRPVTAADVVRGFQRLCGPFAGAGDPLGGPADRLRGLIAGMDRYCADFARVPRDAAAIRGYLASHPLDGVRALDSRTVRFQLTAPAPDFPQLLTMPFTSPMPAEALAALPDSDDFRAHFVGAGPYTVGRYVPGRALTLQRNPGWRRDDDPLRGGHVDRIEVTLAPDAASLRESLRAGAVDVSWLPEPAPEPPAGGRSGAARTGRAWQPLRLSGTDGSGVVYLAANLRSPNENHAMAALPVRQALNFAVDKRGVVQALGGADRYRPHDQILPPSALGYEPFDLYPTPNHRGDPQTARRMLDGAGYGQGLTLTLAYAADTASPALLGALQRQFAAVGVTLQPVGLRADLGGYLRGHGAGPQAWDLALLTSASVPAAAVGRTVFADRLAYPSAANVGGYANPFVARLVDRALGTQRADEARTAWAHADTETMRSAPWVPLASERITCGRSPRVHGWTASADLPCGDLTRVWL